MDIESSPKCKKIGNKVTYLPVKKLLKDNSKLEETLYHICMDEYCDVSYYNNELNQIYYNDDLKEPLWYKKESNPKYICYCGKVEEKDIINAVLKKDAKDMEDIIRITRAMKNSNCKENNPLGKCCASEIGKTIEKALNMKNTI